MEDYIEKCLIRHMVVLGWFYVETVNDDQGVIMVCGHDGSEDKRPCGLAWMKYGPSEFWINSPGSVGDYKPCHVDLKVI